ncbi:hypothetical protein EXU57_07595 [Segetibacter sp. 3557_3]|uniref:DUF4175 family protein n=1 Tax=Segetibacter sp. 3557_3 TaxID=2547429 RepID=UPI00105898D6|nr:DUF4175 family protein [Segetibacter sp. 3557_3]TDH27439.1 hypothetical protein EXU57_07595 [Segetibacter sp. 3557_3]
MHESRGQELVASFQKRWSAKILFAYLLLFAAALIMMIGLFIRFGTSTWPIALMLCITAVAAKRHRWFNPVKQDEVVRYLNSTAGHLQESAALLLKAPGQMNPLEKLQAQKILQAPVTVPEPPGLRKRLQFGAGLLIAAVVVVLLMLLVAPNQSGFASLAPLAGPKAETKLAAIRLARIRISPPAYTRKPAREQGLFNLIAEDGATVSWQVTTTLAVNSVELIFNDKQVLRLKPSTKDQTEWQSHKKITAAGFYQVRINNTLSELYSIELRRDQPPAIIVRSPKPTSLIEYGQPSRALVDVLLTDDYSITAAAIHATIASGSGEAVKFKEQQLTFLNFTPGKARYQLNSRIDLNQMGMQPGDELYFYISARDSYEQEKRSDIFIVRLEDTARLMEIEGLANGVDLKPEFFRSQRQIIIETEQLLKDRDTMSAALFAAKSNDLGVDQKLLRLRYGKFLGEETDNEIGEDHDHEGEEHAEEFGNTDKVVESYAHKHDIAEDATFFDPQTKKQLKATLGEMWKAELQLRTIKPRDALPFEYRALRLLKDLQQKSRSYVAKTGIKTTPLQPGKRLTGELADVNQPVYRGERKAPEDNALVVRKALGVLGDIRPSQKISAENLGVLQQAANRLSVFAANKPAVFLPGYKALRNVLEGRYQNNDIRVAGMAFQQMLTSPAERPHATERAPNMRLGDRYLMNLNRKHD